MAPSDKTRKPSFPLPGENDAFKAALASYIGNHDWQPAMAERIEGFATGWGARRDWEENHE